ncbi:hypothetical protein UA08_05596 [Talaromyces atroroseus]|uniref:SGNH hydrolase-type esterase domain-containing protein n=1 Tax=Talaromyces atroroseus TaxID=1441469 RepID=A0A225ACK1_TALAT|nr:hypothetical protein UA08_05596 [Talaromyces atroroseus]OKL58861.1 hypothetical protein UA08_05596 [Talaromyces atroroseus]
MRFVPGYLALSLVSLGVRISARPAPLPKFSYIFTFGDSYTATGFNYTGTQPNSFNPIGNPAFPGDTTTNGDNWVDFLITEYNTSLILDYDFAVGGATIDNSIVPAYLSTVASFVQQVNDRFAALSPAPAWDSDDALFTIWFGINDISRGYDAQTWGNLSLTLVDRYFDTVQTLYDAGARYFLVMTVPPIQRSPSILAENTTAQATTAYAVASYNQLIAKGAEKFQGKNPGATVIVFDTSPSFNKALDDPTAYGAPNATCYNSDGTDVDMSSPAKLRNATWLHPIRGIVYFLRHPFLWPLLRGRLLPVFLLSGFIYTILFLFTYIPQVAFLAVFQGSSAWVNGAFLVLGEGAAIVALLFEAFFVDETLVDVFDAVLVKEGFEHLVNRERVIYPDGATPVQRLGKPTTSAIYAPFSMRQIIEFIVLLPLNFVPVAGVPMFLVLTGYRAGPFHHWRYFQLLDFTKDKRKQFVRNRQLKYTAFGTVALIFQLIPILSMFFLLTSAAGSALWAAEMEKHKEFFETQRPEGDGYEYRDDPL